MIIGPNLWPAAARVVQSSAPVAPSVDLFERRDDEAFVKTTKMPVDPKKVTSVVGHDGEPRIALSSDRGQTFLLLKKDGSIDFRFDLPQGERLGGFIHEPRHNCFYLRGGHHFWSLDASSGELLGHLEFDRLSYARELDLDPSTGRPTVFEGQTMIRCSPGLKVEKEVQLPHEIHSIKRLSGDILVALTEYPEKLLHLKDDNSATTLSRDPVWRSVAQSADGDVWFTEGRIRLGKPLTVARYSPDSGEIQRFKSSPDASTIVPLSDGRVLVYDDKLAAPGLMLYDQQGDRLKHIRLGKDQFLRQFYLEHREQSAYAVLDRYIDQGPSEWELVRIDLETEQGFAGWLTQTATMFGQRERPEAIYKTKDESFLPAPLEDGSFLIFLKNRIDHVSSEAEVLTSFSGPAELAKAFPEPKTTAVGITLDHTAKSTVEAGFSNYLAAATAWYGYPTNPTTQVVEGWELSEKDQTLNRRQSLRTRDALDEMGLESADDYAKLLASNTIFNTVLKNQMVPFPDSPGSKVEVGTDRTRVWYPGPEGMIEKSFRLPPPDFFTCALPFMAAGAPNLLLGRSDGLLEWHQLERGNKQTFATQGRVQGLVAGQDRVYAVTESGEVLVLGVKAPNFLAPAELSLRHSEQPPPLIDEIDGNLLIGSIEIEIQD